MKDDFKKPTSIGTENAQIHKYRMYCTACTNIAYYTTDDKMIGEKPCQTCGKPVRWEKQNLIKLT